MKAIAARNVYAQKHAVKRMFFQSLDSHLGDGETCPKNLSRATPVKVAESSALFRNIAMHKGRF
jgi:hypothetical protein